MRRRVDDRATDPVRSTRRSFRLSGYDYAQAGVYFVTICTQDRACLFGDIAADHMHLNDIGQMVAETWAAIPARFPDIEIDEFVVMPNHIHGIVVLQEVAAATGSGAQSKIDARSSPTLGEIVAAFKSGVTVEYIRGVKSRGWPRFRERLWQRNYYEHVLRNEASLSRVRRYMDENPARWAFR
jgi:putative transposase